MLETLLVSPVVRAVALALLHFLWQGAVIAVAAAWLLHGLRRSSAASRYMVGCVALAVMTAAPIVTTFRLLDVNVPAAAASSDRGATMPATPASIAPDQNREAAEPLFAADVRAARAGDRSSWPSVVVLVWMLGVLVMTSSLVVAWLRAARLKRTAVPVGEPWSGQMAELVRRLGVIRGIVLSQSAAIDVPTLVGWVRPAILLPASVLTGLTPAQLDAILVHELAHVRRHDYIVNVLQSVVETLLFYHPAVWWVSGRVRVERELCCDDLVLAVCGDRVVYARALASLEDLRARRAVLGMAATDGPLLERIRRILVPERVDESRSSAWSVVTAVVTVLPLVVFGVAADEPTEVAKSPQPVVEAAAIPAPTIRLPETRVVTPVPVARNDGQVQAAAGATSDQKSVLASEEQFRLAKVQGNVQALDRLLDDAVVSTNQTGVTRNKTELLELWKTFRVNVLTLDSADVRVAGDLATVTGRQTEINATGTEPMLFTRVWRRASGAWRLFSVTQFRDPNPGPTAAPVSPRVFTLPRLFLLEYELFRDDLLIGRPVIRGRSGSQWPIEAPGELPVAARAVILNNDVVELSLTPPSGPMSTLTLLGPEPTDVSWKSATATYRIRVRNLTSTLPPDSAPISVGGDVRRPEKIKDVPPVYPPEAKAAGVAGMVIVEIVIDEAGDVRSAEIVRSVPMLDAAALQAVRQWKYTPTTVNGRPVAVRTSVNITFATK